jgi:hypothetical protein
MNINYLQKFQTLASCLLRKYPSKQMIEDYYAAKAVSYGLQDFCADNAIHSWNTGIGIIEAVENMLDTAQSNANLNANWEEQ